MKALAADQFGDFFHAVHGCEPFDWQRRFAKEALAGGFHDVIRVPTGCGKTSVLDVEAFELALQAERTPAERTAARRICFVVDRRLVVDEVTEHCLADSRRRTRGRTRKTWRAGPESRCRAAGVAGGRS